MTKLLKADLVRQVVDLRKRNEELRVDRIRYQQEANDTPHEALSSICDVLRVSKKTGYHSTENREVEDKVSDILSVITDRKHELERLEAWKELSTQIMIQAKLLSELPPRFDQFGVPLNQGGV